MDPATILALVVAGVGALAFCAGAGGVHLWLSERIAWRDETIRTLREALEREHAEATVAADSRRDMAAADRARADALAAPDARDRLKRVLDLLPAGGGKPAAPAGPGPADAGAGRAPRLVS